MKSVLIFGINGFVGSVMCAPLPLWLLLWLPLSLCAFQALPESSIVQALPESAQVQTPPDSTRVQAIIAVPSSLPLPADWSGSPPPVPVILLAVVLPDSTLGEVSIVYAEPPLDSLAVQILRAASLVPATIGGTPVADTVRVTFIFEEPETTGGVSADSLAALRIRQRENIEAWHQAHVRHQSSAALPVGALRENFHLLGLPGNSEPLFRDGFSVHEGAFLPMFELQQWLPFYHLDRHNDALHLNTTPYVLAPTYSRAILGVGGEQMNHAAISLRKGHMFSRPTLRARFDYAGYEGRWTGQNETAGDFFVQLADSLAGAELRLQFVQFDQEIPAARLSPSIQTSLGKVNHRLDEVTATLSWHSYTAGVRQTRCEIGQQGALWDSLRRTWLLRAEHNLIGQRLLAQLERTSDENLWTLRADGGWQTLSWSLLLQDANTFAPEQHYALRLNTLPWLTLGVSFADRPLRLRGGIERGERRLMGSLLLGNEPNSVRLEAGAVELEQTVGGERQDADAVAFRLDVALEANTGPLVLRLRLDQEAISVDSLWYLPRFVGRVQPEIELPLPHDNHIAVGAGCTWSDEYTTPAGIREQDSLSLDAWLRIGITRWFSIYVQAQNLTNAERLLGQYAAPTHVNVSLRWAFIN
ncbi:MAG: hypothetical protein K8R90_02775 [Candidatus Cloacimonetes bacterium]|nr:hypothetical protein [Candidatus Cloacimonadota bacterium]